jgi:hypothetical protein
MEVITNYIKKNRQKSVMIVISLSVLLGVLVVRKLALWLPYFIRENNYTSSLPVWFDPYGIAIIALLIGVILIVLINLTFKRYVKELEKEE